MSLDLSQCLDQFEGGQAVDGRDGKNVLDARSFVPVDMSAPTARAMAVAAWRAWSAHSPPARSAIASISRQLSPSRLSNPAGNSGTAVSSAATWSLVRRCACRRRLANPGGNARRGRTASFVSGR
jgi:hypothetical protein